MLRLLLAVVALAAFPASAAAKPLSFDSGLAAQKPCAGAQAKLGPTWRAAGKHFGISWRILAAITKVESSYGCDMGPSSAGAVGWTQFMPATWSQWGMDADGDHKADPNNSVDAIFSSARYLKANGAPGDYQKALLAYNHAQWYVDKVLDISHQFKDFSSAQFDQMAKIARQYSLLEDRLHGAREQLEQLESKTAKARKQLKQSRLILVGGEDKLRKGKQEFEAAKGRLDQATLRYVRTAQGTQAAGQQNQQQQLLSYFAGSNPQDAVLVYVTVRSMLEQQNLQLQQLRLLASAAAEADQQSRAQQTSLSQAAQLEEASLYQLQVLADDQQTTIRSGKADMRKKAKAVRVYAMRYLAKTGDQGALQSSPFADLIQGSVLWAGSWRWPLTAQVTSGFGYRCIDVCRPHEGIDLGAASGTKIHASAPGKVIFAGVMGGYGKMVELSHLGGFTTRYGHMSSITAKVGQQVTPLSVLGKVGCTGHCFGDHLHFEIRKDGQAQNPLPLLPRR